MKNVENFVVISGSQPPYMQKKLDDITTISKNRYKDILKGHHEWVNTLDDTILKSLIDEVRSDSSIIDKIKTNFPNSSVNAVPDIDEIYWAVSPHDAKASDRLLVDCHYDTPFSMIPTGGVIFYRVIIGCNENNDVTTHFPAENVHVKMSRGDYHGLDFNNDYHCVTGTIPPGSFRILLKLHYIIVPKGSESWTENTLAWNKWWAVLSRNILNATSNPANMYDYILSYILNILRYIYLNINYIILCIVILLLIYGFKDTLFIKILRIKNNT